MAGQAGAGVRIGEIPFSAVRRGVRVVVGNLLWSVRQEGLREGRRVRLRAGGCAPGAGGAMERSPPVRFAGLVSSRVRQFMDPLTVWTLLPAAR